MRTISVSFQHWQHMFSEATLTKYGSPYFAKNRAGVALMEEVYAQASRVKSVDTTFSYDQIICGNEAFPEAAVADPIIKDMRLDVTFLELDVPAKRRSRFETVIIPAVVAQGIAERAIHRATAKMAPEEVDYLDYDSRGRKVEVLSRMKPLAEQEIRELLAETNVEADERDFAEITKAVHEQLEGLKKRKPGSAPATRPEGHRFFDLKRKSIEGRLSALRPVGKQFLYFTDLPRPACNHLETDWASDWKLAATPWVRVWGQTRDSGLNTGFGIAREAISRGLYVKQPCRTGWSDRPATSML